MFRKILTVALATGAIAATFGTVSAVSASPGDIEPCKAGGHSKFVDPVTAKPFKSQGRCVSFVNEGGQLVPVESTPVGGGTADIEFVNPYFSDLGSQWNWDVKVSGLPADTVVELSWTRLVPDATYSSWSPAKRIGPLVMSQPDGTLDLSRESGRTPFVTWEYGQCVNPTGMKDVTVRGPGFKVTEPVPVPPACAP